MIGLPVLVMVTSLMCRLSRVLFTVLRPERAAVRRLFILDGLQDFCIVVNVINVN